MAPESKRTLQVVPLAAQASKRILQAGPQAAGASSPEWRARSGPPVAWLRETPQCEISQRLRQLGVEPVVDSAAMIEGSQTRDFADDVIPREGVHVEGTRLWALGRHRFLRVVLLARLPADVARRFDDAVRLGLTSRLRSFHRDRARRTISRPTASLLVRSSDSAARSG